MKTILILLSLMLGLSCTTPGNEDNIKWERPSFSFEQRLVQRRSHIDIDSLIRVEQAKIGLSQQEIVDIVYN